MEENFLKCICAEIGLESTVQDDQQTPLQIWHPVKNDSELDVFPKIEQEKTCFQ